MCCLGGRGQAREGKGSRAWVYHEVGGSPQAETQMPETSVRRLEEALCLLPFGSGSLGADSPRTVLGRPSVRGLSHPVSVGPEGDGLQPLCARCLGFWLVHDPQTLCVSTVRCPRWAEPLTEPQWDA